MFIARQKKTIRNIFDKLLGKKWLIQYFFVSVSVPINIDAIRPNFLQTAYEHEISQHEGTIMRLLDNKAL